MWSGRERGRLSRADGGIDAYPARAGEGIMPEAREMVSRHSILTMLDGHALSRKLGV